MIIIRCFGTVPQMSYVMLDDIVRSSYDFGRHPRCHIFPDPYLSHHVGMDVSILRVDLKKREKKRGDWSFPCLRCSFSLLPCPYLSSFFFLTHTHTIVSLFFSFPITFELIFVTDWRMT